MQIRILAIVDNDDVGQAMRRMMKRLMSDSDAQQFIYRGKSDKHSFAAVGACV